jgi:peptidoglycan hydrolase CwlO-like protein
MKASSFFAGLAVGAIAAIAASKKIKALCADEDDSCDCDNSALKDAENAAETLRNSIDSLKSELSSRIESEQTYAAQCEDLKDQVAKKEAEINNLKNVCDKQAGEISKLEASQG